ncbi:hypothetical protein L7F22_002963 [Adiantum nelumboides]|nr:hypothetical protein [Adiantum nelumboides]
MAMAESDNLASRLLLRQSSVSKRVKLDDPAGSQPLHNLYDEDDDGHGAGVTFSAASSSSPSRLQTGTGKRPRPPRLSSHGLTPELLSHMRPSKIRFSSKPSEKNRLSVFSRVLHPAEEASTDAIEDASNLEWQLLPCLKEVIPGDLRQSVLQPSTDRLSTVIQSDAPRSVHSFPKVSRTSSRHGPVPKPSRLAQSRYSGEQIRDGVSGVDNEAWNFQTKSSIMMWKRRRGKFAVSSPSDAASYMWMSFLNLLRENPDYPEFIYLQPAKASRSTFDPYDLDIVAHNEISSPYFYTMSSAGVTLFRDLDAEKETILHADDGVIVEAVYARLRLSSSFQSKRDCVDAKHVVISPQSDIDEETDLSEPMHAMHANIVAQCDQETSLLEPVCDWDAHLECALDVDHEEVTYAALDEDTGDDVDALNFVPYVFNVNFYNDNHDGDAYSERVQDDDQSMIATGDRVCYDDVMEKEIDAILMHAKFCDIEVRRYLNGIVKGEKILPEYLMIMHDTSNEVQLQTNKDSQEDSIEKDDMELMDMLDDALEGF